MASFVDPRFKTTYIREEKLEYMKNRAMSELENLMAEQTASAEAAPLPSAAAATDEPEDATDEPTLTKTTQCQTAN